MMIHLDWSMTNDDANKALLNAKVLRLSTAATNDGTAVTPALDRSLAPIFM